MKKIMLALVAILCLLSSCSFETKKQEKWQEHFDLGVHYLSDGHYEEAVIAFTAAIEIDEKRAAAYASRGSAYMGSAFIDEAVSDFLEAIEREPSADYFEQLAYGYLAEGDVDSALDTLSGGYEQTEDPGLKELMEAIGHRSAIEGVVLAWQDGLDGSPVKDAIVTLRVPETKEVVLSSKTDNSGKYSVTALPGDYELFVHAEGYLPATVYKHVERDETVSTGIIYLISETDEGKSIVNGQIIDISTDEPIKGASVWIAANWTSDTTEEGAHDGAASAVTDEKGSYTFEDQPVGYYTVFAACDGYITNSVNIVVSNQHTDNWDIQLTPVHVHNWVPANYQEPETCSVCGETQGDVLTPVSEEIGFETDLQVGERYSFTTGSLEDPAAKVMGTLVISDYSVFESDISHEAMEGYEWKSATFSLTFPEDEAYSYNFYRFALDYYDPILAENQTITEENDSEEWGTYTANYCGKETEFVYHVERLVNDVQYDSFRVSVQVPTGYDGALYGVLDSEVMLNEGEDDDLPLIDLSPGVYRFFRFY